MTSETAGTAGTAHRWGSTLDAVVVYAQGALCRRLARGSVPSGRRVRVTGLPRSLDPGSLRVGVVGAAGVRVTGARIEIEAKPLPTGTADALRREVQRLNDARDAVFERRERQQRRIDEIKDLRPVPPSRKRDDAHRRTPVDAWLGLAGFVEERLTALHARLAELDEALRLADHELALAEDRFERASTDAPAAHVDTAVSALVTLDGAADSEVELELEYGVPGAVWVPAYRLTHRRGAEEGRLVLRASVAQRTGEDWTGVRIALATADLGRATDLPRLRSLRIGRSQPAPAPSGWREPPAGLSDLFTGYDAAGPRPAPRSGPTVGGADGASVTVGAAPLPPPPMPAPVLAPPPPSVTQGYGGVPAPFPAAPGAVGAAPTVFGGAPAFAPRSAPPRPDGRARTRGAQPAAPAAPGGAPPPPPEGVAEPVPGPPRPSGDQLDYAALVLSGPEDAAGRRGLLFPGVSYDPVALEYRRRAESVASLPLPGYAVPPRRSAGSFDHRFDAAARADVPSDGTWHTVTVTEIPVGLRTEYLCVPSVEEAVYATLVLSNATGQALLAGPVEVTVDDGHLLTAALPTLAPGGVCRVGLGQAEGIRVVRRSHLLESTAGLRNNVTVLDHRVRVELANRLAGPVSVEVRERVPVTSAPDVRIEERGDWTVPEDGAGPEHHVPGTRVRRVELPAGGTAALDGGYEIRIPAGKALAGGNRRS